jgi:hypothetical protein
LVGQAALGPGLDFERVGLHPVSGRQQGVMGFSRSIASLRSEYTWQTESRRRRLLNSSLMLDQAAIKNGLDLCR